MSTKRKMPSVNTNTNAKTETTMTTATRTTSHRCCNFVTPERKRIAKADVPTDYPANSCRRIADIEKIIRDGMFDVVVTKLEKKYAAYMATKGVYHGTSLKVVPVIARKGEMVWVQETKEKESLAVLQRDWCKGDETVAAVWEAFSGRKGKVMNFDVHRVWLVSDTMPRLNRRRRYSSRSPV